MYVYFSVDERALQRYGRTRAPTSWWQLDPATDGRSLELDDPANRRRIAWVNRHTGPMQYDRSLYEVVNIGNSQAVSLGELVAGLERLIDTDPPEHTRLRNLVSRGFTPKVMRSMEDHFHEVAARLIDEAVAAGDVEFVDAVSSELPLVAIAELLGIPYDAASSYLRGPAAAPPLIPAPVDMTM